MIVRHATPLLGNKRQRICDNECPDEQYTTHYNIKYSQANVCATRTNETTGAKGETWKGEENLRERKKKKKKTRLNQSPRIDA